jgi:hypothetical protein
MTVASVRAWLQPTFQPAMVGLDHVVGVLLGDMPSSRRQIVKNARIDRRAIRDDTDR